METIALTDRGLIVIGERGCEIFGGADYARVGALLKGTSTDRELLAADEADGETALSRALAVLRQAGLVVDSEDAGFDAAWWSSQGLDPAAARQRLSGACVDVRAVGVAPTSAVNSALTALGIALSPAGSHTVVITSDYLAAELDELNREALAAGREWLIARPFAAEILIGPVLGSIDGPCWQCLAQRMRFQLGLAARLRRLASQHGARSNPPSDEARPGGPATTLAPGGGAAILASEVAAWLAGLRREQATMILSIDTRTWSAERHHAVWRAQCRACGGGLPDLRREIMPIRRTGGGSAARKQTLRSAEPEETIRRFEHHVSRICGAVSTLHRLPGPEPMHVYVAGGPVAGLHGDRDGWQEIAGTPAGGKGTTDAAARASALAEALERYSGGFGGDEPRRRGSLDQLEGAAIHPNDYMRFSDRQYAAREHRHAGCEDHRTYVPEPFDPSVPIDWSPCWSLTRDAPRLLPTALLYYGASVPGREYCVAESNGNAAGNTLDEAILHGLLELIERDHVALWWYNRLHVPEVDLDSIDDDWVQRLRVELARQGRRVWVLDLTFDLGIPVAAALASHADGRVIGMGFGGHVDAHGAATRALTELVQLGLGGTSGGGGTRPADLDLVRHPFLRPGKDLAPRGPVARPARWTVQGALAWCQAAIEGAGIEVLVLDQTRPDVGLPVVKAIAPGLRHFWARFGSGRLYDVPVTLGILPGPRSESELTERSPTS